MKKKIDKFNCPVCCNYKTTLINGIINSDTMILFFQCCKAKCHKVIIKEIYMYE